MHMHKWRHGQRIARATLCVLAMLSVSACNRSLLTWGNNANGQLGDGTTTNRATPTVIDADWFVTSSGESGGFFTVAVRNDHTLWAWGSDGSIFSFASPTQIGAAANWATISAGQGHVLGLRTDGTLWAWGQNSFGQLAGFRENPAHHRCELAGRTSQHFEDRPQQRCQQRFQRHWRITCRRLASIQHREPFLIDRV